MTRIERLLKMMESSYGETSREYILTYLKGWDPDAKWVEGNKVKIVVPKAVSNQDILDGAKGEINDHNELYVDKEFNLPDGRKVLYIGYVTK